MADISVTVDQVQDMDFNELCEFLENMEVDYSSLENIEDLRDLLIQSITGQNSSNNASQTQNQVHLKKAFEEAFNTMTDCTF